MGKVYGGQGGKKRSNSGYAAGRLTMRHECKEKQRFLICASRRTQLPSAELGILKEGERPGIQFDIRDANYSLRGRISSQQLEISFWRTAYSIYLRVTSTLIILVRRPRKVPQGMSSTEEKGIL